MGMNWSRRLAESIDGGSTEGAPYHEDLFNGPYGDSLAGAIGNIEDVVGGERYVGGLALHDLFERNGDFILRAEAFAAVDEGLFTGEGRQPFGEREHLHDGGIGPVLDGESAWFLDVTDDVDLADFGNADLFAAGQ